MNKPIPDLLDWIIMKQLFQDATELDCFFFIKTVT